MQYIPYKKLHWWNALYPVLRARLTNNRGGCQESVFGHKYKDVSKKYGLGRMIEEYRLENSWNVPITNWFWPCIVLLVLHILRFFW